MNRNPRTPYIWAMLTVFILGVFGVAAVLLSGIQENQEVIFEDRWYVMGFFALLLLMPLSLFFVFVSNSLQRRKQVRAMERELTALETPVKPKPAPQSEKKPSVEEKKGKNRFSKLSAQDKEAGKGNKRQYVHAMSLKELCRSFRNFAAYELGLYYDEEQIRQFIAGMGTSKILIMQGMSGTGKTSLAYAFGEYLANPSTIVPIQPMWKDRTDLVGYYNEFTKKFNETTLLEKMYEAGRREDIYITVLDEMNIARVEYYFAEFLSLLEIPNEAGRYLDVVPDHWADDPERLKNGRIVLPTNMWFIGTANNDDSTFAIADKVYDRAMVMNLDSKAKPFHAPATPRASISVRHWQRLVKDALSTYEMTDRNRRRLAELDAYMIEQFHISFGNRITKQIHTYIPLMLACGGDELAALDDILAKKVLRKLESCNPIYVKNSAEAFRNFLDELFGYDAMKSCKAYLLRLERNA